MEPQLEEQSPKHETNNRALDWFTTVNEKQRKTNKQSIGKTEGADGKLPTAEFLTHSTMYKGEYQ